MVYFIIITVVTCALALVLFLLFLRSFNIYLKKTWKKAWHYFQPTIFALLLLILLAFVVAPRLFDSLDMARGQYEVVNAKVVEIRLPQTVVLENGDEFTYSRLEEQLTENTTYSIKIAPRTEFAISFEVIEN